MRDFYDALLRGAGLTKEAPKDPLGAIEAGYDAAQQRERERAAAVAAHRETSEYFRKQARALGETLAELEALEAAVYDVGSSAAGGGATITDVLMRPAPGSREVALRHALTRYIEMLEQEGVNG